MIRNKLGFPIPAKSSADITFDISAVPTPAYVVDRDLLQLNLDVLKYVQLRSGCKILLAQKAFSMYSLYPQIATALVGTTASGIYEAKLGAEYFPGETHVFSPAYHQNDMPELLTICDYIIFNSFEQYDKFADDLKKADIPPSAGIRINPEHSTQDTPLYDPCAPGSRLGVTRANFKETLPEGIEGFHFHTLCEQGFDSLLPTWEAVEAKFAHFLPQLKWLNMGGGHHITRQDYDVDSLIELIQYIRNTYNLQVYLEPGEAVVLNTGFLVCEVMEIVHNEISTLILDCSAECHMPDVLAMPYRPELVACVRGKEIISGQNPNEAKYTYRLSSCTCLAGDVVGDYSFDQEIRIGDRLIFFDMALYTMVKNNTFNGMPLPTILSHSQKSGLRVERKFTYEDFQSRL